MHIALVTPEFGACAGGIGTSLATLATGLARRGHRVTVVSRGPLDRSSAWSGCRIHRIPCPPGHVARWSFRCVADLVTRSVRPDVVHAPEWGAVAATLALSSRVPIVTRLDTPSFLVRELNGRARPTAAEALVERAERSQARRSRLVLSASSAVGTLVQQRWDLPVARLRLLRNPVDNTYLRSRAAAPWPVPVPPGGVVYIGRLESRKGMDVLAPLLAAVLAQTATRVTVIGGPADGHGPVGERIRQALARFGDRVSYLGRLRHGSAMTVVAGADVVVVPSVWENAPLVVMESMALGRCVVAAAVGGIPELVDDGVTGFLVAGRDAAEWTQRVVALLADRPRRAEAGERAVGAATAWDVGRVAVQAEMLYEEATR